MKTYDTGPRLPFACERPLERDECAALEEAWSMPIDRFTVPGFQIRGISRLKSWGAQSPRAALNHGGGALVLVTKVVTEVSD